MKKFSRSVHCRVSGSLYDFVQEYSEKTGLRYSAAVRVLISKGLAYDFLSHESNLREKKISILEDKLTWLENKFGIL